MIAPEITIMADMDEGGFRLYAHSYGKTQPAGDRLLHVAKGQPWPDIEYHHADMVEANKHAERLRAHIASWGKSASKAKVRAMGAD